MNHTLPTLQHELVRTHRARLARRRAIGAAAVTLPALALLAVLLPNPGSATLRVASSSPPAAHAADDPPALSAIHNPQSAIRNSFITIVHDTPKIASMSDDELLAALADAGQPSGLITINGKTTVVSNQLPAAMSISADPQ